MTLMINAASLDAAALPGAAIAFASETRIADEQPHDVAAREALLDNAFGADRFAKTAERLRAGRLPAHGLSLAARRDGALVGTLRCWNIRAGGVPALLLGPLAVAASHRSLGVGAGLMREAVARAAALGHKAVLLVGDAPYYARFGFDAALAAHLVMPGPVDRARFLALELEEGALDGAEGVLAASGARAGKRVGSAHRQLRRAA